MNNNNKSNGILLLGRLIYSGRTGNIVNNYIRAIERAGINYVSIDSVTRRFVGAANGRFWKWNDQHKVLTSNRKLAVIFNEKPEAIEKIKTNGPVRLIGSTLFNAAQPEDWANHMETVGELWVPTQFQKDAIEHCGISSHCLKIIPYCVDMDFFDPGIAPLKIPGVREFVFLTILAEFHRENLHGLNNLIRSYYQAFQHHQDTTLLIRVTDPSPEVITRIEENIRPEFFPVGPTLPHVRILNEPIKDERMRQLYNLCDVYISTAKEKQWDFLAMEAMAMGKPVIKEVVKNPLEILNEKNAFLIPCTDTISTEERVANMKKVLFNAYSNRDLCKDKGLNARNQIFNHYSIDVVGKRIRMIIDSYRDDKYRDKGKAVIDMSEVWEKWEKNAQDISYLPGKNSPQVSSPPRIALDPLITREDIRRLKALHNKFKGNRIFVIGNGPSLNKTPLHLLKNEFTFGANRIYLLFDRIDWRPAFYTAFDLRVVPDNKDEINALDIQYKFFATKHRTLLGESKNKYWYQDNSRRDGLDNRFEPEAVYTGFGGGGSITHLAIQIAFYLGFDPIYLVGVDADYKILPTVLQSGPDKFGDGILLNLQSTKDDDPNHFDPRYFGKGKKWHNPNVPEMLRGFLDCRLAIEKRGHRIYNATVGGKLYIFDRVEFSSLFR